MQHVISTIAPATLDSFVFALVLLGAMLSALAVGYITGSEIERHKSGRPSRFP